LRKEYNRHTEGDKVSIEGSAMAKTHRISVWAQRKKAIDTQDRERMSKAWFMRGW